MEDKEKLEFNKPCNLNIEYIIVDNNLFNDYRNIKNNYILYYRWVLDKYINSEKVIFMDTDIIIRWDISKLYCTDLWNSIIWASKDCVLRNTLILEEYGIKKYFNAWVQLINLKRWKNEDIWKKAFSFLNKNYGRLPLYDQDTLNIILKDDWLCLSPKYNWLWRDKIWYKESQYSKKEYDELNNPIIIHYAWPTHRPWKWLICLHPYRYFYFKYIFKTKYRDSSDIFMFIFRIFSSNIIVRYIGKTIITVLWKIRRIYLNIKKWQ